MTSSFLSDSRTHLRTTSSLFSASKTLLIITQWFMNSLKHFFIIPQWLENSLTHYFFIIQCLKNSFNHYLTITQWLKNTRTLYFIMIQCLTNSLTHYFINSSVTQELAYAPLHHYSVPYSLLSRIWINGCNGCVVHLHTWVSCTHMRWSSWLKHMCDVQHFYLWLIC